MRIEEPLSQEAEMYLMQQEETASKTGVRTYIHTSAGYFLQNSIFEAETVKGNKNYIVFFFEKNGWVYYCHGDKGKKVEASKFLKMIDYGDLVYVPRERAEPERIALSVLGLKAMSEGLTFNDYLLRAYNYGDGSKAQNIDKY